MPKAVNYTCVKCSLSGSSMVSWGKFYYLIKGKRLPINRITAICHDCNSIAPIEVLPSKEINPHNFSNREIETFIEERESLPRCLNCGGHDYDRIPKVERDKKRDKLGLPYRTRTVHSGCGGHIYADFSTPNLFMGDRLSTRFFNIEGLEIERKDSIS